MVFMVTSSFEPFLGCLLTWHYLLPAFKFYSAATANEISCLQMGQLKSGHLASKQSFVQVASCLCRVSSCWLGCWVDIMIKADVRSRQEIFVLAKNKKYVLHMMRQGMPHHTFSAVFLNIAQKLKLPPSPPLPFCTSYTSYSYLYFLHHSVALSGVASCYYHSA